MPIGERVASPPARAVDTTPAHLHALLIEDVVGCSLAPMLSQPLARRRRAARRGMRGPLKDARLNARTAAWLGGLLWRPALIEARRHVRSRRRTRRR